MRQSTTTLSSLRKETDEKIEQLNNIANEARGLTEAVATDMNTLRGELVRNFQMLENRFEKTEKFLIYYGLAHVLTGGILIGLIVALLVSGGS